MAPTQSQLPIPADQHRKRFYDETLTTVRRSFVALRPRQKDLAVSRSSRDSERITIDSASSDPGPSSVSESTNVTQLKLCAVCLEFIVWLKKPSKGRSTYLVECCANGKRKQTEEKNVLSTDISDDGYVLVSWTELPLYMYGVSPSAPMDIHLVRLVYPPSGKKGNPFKARVASWRLNSRKLQNSRSDAMPDEYVTGERVYGRLEPVSALNPLTKTVIITLNCAPFTRRQVTTHSRLFPLINEAMVLAECGTIEYDDEKSPYAMLKYAILKEAEMVNNKARSRSKCLWTSIFSPTVDSVSSPRVSIASDGLLINASREEYCACADLVDRLCRIRECYLTAMGLLRRLNRNENVQPSSLYLNLDDFKETEYKITHSGGYSIVKQTINTVRDDGKLWALKIPDVDKTDKPQDRLMMFCREAIQWRYLCHPHILPFCGLAIEGHPPLTSLSGCRMALVSPWMKHGDILSYLQIVDRKVVPRGQRVKLVAEVVCGLNYLAKLGFCHGDIRARNILVDEKEHAHLGDFGIATVIQTFEKQTRTRPATLGHSRWTAPEVKSVRDRSPQSDVYSLACTMWEIFTGVPMPTEGPLERMPLGEGPDGYGEPIDTLANGLTEAIWRKMKQSWLPEPKERPTLEEWAWCLKHELEGFNWKDREIFVTLAEEFGW